MSGKPLPQSDGCTESVPDELLVLVPVVVVPVVVVPVPLVVVVVVVVVVPLVPVVLLVILSGPATESETRLFVMGPLTPELLEPVPDVPEPVPDVPEPFGTTTLEVSLRGSNTVSPVELFVVVPVLPSPVGTTGVAPPFAAFTSTPPSSFTPLRGCVFAFKTAGGGIIGGLPSEGPQ